VTSESDRQGMDEYLVAPRANTPDGPRALQGFITAVGSASGATLVRTYGQDAPQRVVVSMTPELAERFRAQFGQSLIIEANAPLKPFTIP
jgi:hypothetical protein